MRANSISTPISIQAMPVRKAAIRFGKDIEMPKLNDPKMDTFLRSLGTRDKKGAKAADNETLHAVLWGMTTQPLQKVDFLKGILKLENLSPPILGQIITVAQSLISDARTDTRPGRTPALFQREQATHLLTSAYIHPAGNKGTQHQAHTTLYNSTNDHLEARHTEA